MPSDPEPKRMTAEERIAAIDTPVTPRGSCLVYRTDAALACEAHAAAETEELRAQLAVERDRVACALASDERRTEERNVAYAALAGAAKALALNDFDGARDILCRSTARDRAAELRRADMKDVIHERDRAEKAEAQLAQVTRERDQLKVDVRDALDGHRAARTSEDVSLRAAQQAEAALAASRAEVDWYQHRCDMLLRAQREMRDPERKVVCDIIANGTTYVEPFRAALGAKEGTDA